MALLFFKDAVVSVVAGAGLYLSFSRVNRSLALVGAAGWLISTAAFLPIDAIEASMLHLARDAAEGGQADQAAVLQTARTLAIASGLMGQAAFSAFALGVASFGVMFIRHRGAAVPPVWVGWLSLFVAASWLLVWTSALSEAGFAFIPLGGISTIVLLISLGVYLVRHPGGAPDEIREEVSGLVESPRDS